MAHPSKDEKELRRRFLQQKWCNVCGQWRAIKDFNKSKKYSDGLTTDCKYCVKARNQAYYLNNKEKIEGINELWRKNNLDRVRDNRRQWRDRNREKVRESNRRWKDDNAERNRKANLAWIANNSEKHRENGRRWREENREKWKESNRRNRARRMDAVAIPYSELEIFERDNWICAECEGKVDSALRYPDPMSKSIDHIIPISRGGSDSPANVQLMHLVCNLKKGIRIDGQNQETDISG